MHFHTTCSGCDAEFIAETDHEGGNYLTHFCDNCAADVCCGCGAYEEGCRASGSDPLCSCCDVDLSATAALVSLGGAQ